MGMHPDKFPQHNVIVPHLREMFHGQDGEYSLYVDVHENDVFYAGQTLNMAGRQLGHSAGAHNHKIRRADIWQNARLIEVGHTTRANLTRDERQLINECRARGACTNIHGGGVDESGVELYRDPRDLDGVAKDHAVKWNLGYADLGIFDCEVFSVRLVEHTTSGPQWEMGFRVLQTGIEHWTRIQLKPALDIHRQTNKTRILANCRVILGRHPSAEELHDLYVHGLTTPVLARLKVATVMPGSKTRHRWMDLCEHHTSVWASGFDYMQVGNRMQSALTHWNNIRSAP